jgi:hypothetical protein
MKRAKSGGKPQKYSAEYRDFFKSIEKLVKYLGEVTAREVVVYEPIVNGLINARSKNRKKIESTLTGLLDFCGNSAILQLYKKLCRYYYCLDPKATAQYVLFYLERWDPEGLKKIRERQKRNETEGT